MRKLLPQMNIKYRLVFSLFIAIFYAQGAFAQGSILVKGKVSDSEGASLPGAAVMEKGTANGTITDLDGGYELSVTSEESVLVISFMGHTSQEVVVGNQTQISTTLQMADLGLDEVIVVGYGEMKKRDVTGSVGSINNEALTEKGLSSPMEAMQGTIAGVNISSSTGRIGDEFSVQIRGVSSLSDAGPLYVVDGIPTDGISFLNPQDIERIDVLKDASSTAIYGSRASNGVVLVTTKSGASAKSGITVSLDSYYGVRKTARLPEMMGGNEFWKYHNAAYLATTGSDPMAITPEQLESKVVGPSNIELKRRADAGEIFDWYDAVLQDGASSNNYVSISGNNGGTSFNLGLGRQTETGLIQNESLTKYSFKSAITHKANEKLTIGANLTLSVSDIERGSEDAMQEAFRLNPFLTPYGFDGELFLSPGKLTYADGSYAINKTSTINPLLEIANTSDLTKRWTLLGNAFAQYKPLSWLTMKSTLSMGYDTKSRAKAWGAQTNQGSKNGKLPLAELEKNESLNYTWDNQIDAVYTLNDNHNFSFMAVQSLFSDTYTQTNLASKEMPYELGAYDLASGSNPVVGTRFVRETLSSVAMRLRYDYKGKYLFSFATRWDGSSKLAVGKQWNMFPSVSAAWRVTEEKFMKGNEVISDLKLRASYGFVGDNSVPAYSTINGLDGTSYYEFNGTPVKAQVPTKLANNELTWANSEEYNLGLDFGLFGNRISGTIDVYKEILDGMIMGQKLPSEFGWNVTQANVGAMGNKGLELSLKTINIDNDFITWETNFVFSRNINELITLYGDKVDDIGNSWFIGENSRVFYNYEYAGVWQASEADEAAKYNQKEGQAKVKDQNNDGRIDQQDKIILGQVDAKWLGSFSSRLRVGAFDLSTSIITSQGAMVNSSFHANFADTKDRGRQKMAGLDYYVPANSAGLTPNFTNTLPQPRNEGAYGDTSNDEVQFYKDASFVKVKNISLGYTFQKALLSKVNLKSVRVYVNVIDPFVFTEYEGYDPEWAGASLGVNRVGSVTYQIGANIKF